MIKKTIEAKEIVIEIDKLKEEGFTESMQGLALSFKKSSEEMLRVAQRICNKDEGHNKFLEQIMTWWMIRAPRYWWQEADTYRISSKSSESTIHTLVKELKNINIRSIEAHIYRQNNFENGSCTDEQFNELIIKIHNNFPIYSVKGLLPEGFLQKRMWMLSYKQLRNIILQRRFHPLPHWQYFCKTILLKVNCPALLGID